MKNSRTFSRVFFIFATILFVSSVLYAQGPNPDLNNPDVLNMAKAEHYLHSQQRGFEENKGQVKGADASNVKFTFKDSGLSIFLLNNGLAYQFSKTHYPEGYKHLDKFADFEEFEKMDELSEDIRIETYRMDVNLVGANPNPRISAEGKSLDYTQYYNHNALNVHHYTQITYHNVYPGIDWVIYSKNGGVKYDFIVNPGADPNQIKLQTSWVEELKLNKDGSLTLHNCMGSITEQTPISFQGKKEIKTNFVITQDQITFELENYNPNQILVIDPNLQWATYYGGSENDYGNSCAVDNSGNVYLAGETRSTSEITSGGHQNSYGGGTNDAFLVKFNSNGVREWGTYYGGSNLDRAHSCAVDGSGNVYLAGRTNSTSAIAFWGHQNSYVKNTDAFLVKFNSNGVRLWATYYGGGFEDRAHSCAVDDSGNVYLAGETRSNSAIASGGHQNSFGGGPGDAFLVKFNSSGIRLWSTYYGGANNDIAQSCAVDSSGNIYLAGRTNSISAIASGGHQNTNGGGYDAFLVKFNSMGVRQWGTYYGGDGGYKGGEWGNSCAVDGSGNVYLAGSTSSLSAIAFGGHQNSFGGTPSDAFLVKFNSMGVRQWGTYYGGVGRDRAYSCAVDNSGNIYLAGQTSSQTAISSGGQQNIYGGGYDAFLVKFNSMGVRLWGTYYGGSGAELSFSCAVDVSGNLYVAGETNSISAIAAGGHQNTFGGGLKDAFLAKFGDICFPTIDISSNYGTIICKDQEIVFTAVVSMAGTNPSYQWKRNGSNVGSDLPTYTSSFNNTGDVITCELTTYDAPCVNSTIVVSNELILTVVTNVDPIFVQDVTICTGQSQYVLPSTSLNGFSGTWSPEFNNMETTSYVFTPDVGQCSTTDTMTIVVDPNIIQTIFTGVEPICAGDGLNALPTTSINGISGTWSPALNNVSTTTYTFTPDLGQCGTLFSMTIEVHPLPIFSIQYSANTFEATGGFESYSWLLDGTILAGETESTLIPLVNGVYTVIVTDANGCQKQMSMNYNGVIEESSANLENNAQETLMLYPNPSAGSVHIEFSDIQSRELRIYDNVGKLVYQTQSFHEHLELNLENLATGTYHLNVYQASGVLHRVIVLSK